MKLYASPDRARGRVLNRDFFTFFCYLISTVGYISDVEFEFQMPRFSAPKRDAGGQIRGEVLWQPRPIFNNRSTTVSHRSAGPKIMPTVVIRDLRSSGMSLVECWDNALSILQGFVTGEPSGNRPIEVGAGKRILESSADTQLLKLPDIQHHLKTFRASLSKVNGHEYARNADLVILKSIVSVV